MSPDEPTPVPSDPDIKDPETDGSEDPDAPEPEVTAEDLMGATEGNAIQTEDSGTVIAEGTDIPGAPGPGPVDVPLEDPEPSSVTAESQDPALRATNEDLAAIHEGTSNDMAARLDGSVEAQGDVEIATVPEVSSKGESYPPLTVEDTVILNKSDLVPPRLVGRRAFIIDAPRTSVAVEKADDVWITVRTRDEVNATLTLPLSTVTIERGGRSPVIRG